MDIVGIIIGVILSVIGIIGSILPGIPGPQLGYIALIIAQSTLNQPFSRSFIIIWGIINIGVLIIDYFLPILGTKKFWGTKRGNTGCIIGMIVGLFAGPAGLLFGPFLGALVGEYLHQQDSKKSLKAAVWAFLGFASGIVIKLVISIIMLGYIIAVSIQHFL